MARNEQLIRQHKLLQLLESRRYGATLKELRDDLVESLGLSSLNARTVRRDLEALQHAGFDLGTQDVSGRRVWKLGPLARKALHVQATATELLALSVGRDLLLPLVGTQFGKGIESFWNRIREDLPDSVWDHYQKYRNIMRVLGIPAKSYVEKEGMLKTINRAILGHRIVQAEYQSLGNPLRERKIEPYAMILWQGSLYLVGGDGDLDIDDTARIKHWKLDRFERATALDQWFTLPESFDLDEFLGNSLGVFSGPELQTYRIWVSAAAAPWVIEDPWQPEQQTERQEDGSLILSLVSSHAMDVIPRVLALGREARVIEPAEVASQVKSILKDALAGYG